VDGHPVRRHLPGPITPSSVIQIRLVSERLTPEELTVKDPVIFSWHRGQDWQQTEQLNDQSLSLPVSRLQGLVTPDSSSRAVVPVLILLPQVFDKNQSPLLPENAQERLLTLFFKE
jgi:hypothetical protein